MSSARAKSVDRMRGFAVHKADGSAASKIPANVLALASRIAYPEKPEYIEAQHEPAFPGLSASA